jgi:hypothetical protein
MRRPARRRSTVAPPMVPDSTLTRKAKKLPMFGTGIVISIPLHLWPTYKEIYELEVLGPKQIAWLREHGIPKKDGVLYVRRVPKMKESHE